MSRSKLGHDNDGVYLQPTSLGRCALAIPLDYIDTAPGGQRDSAYGRLILDLDDAEELGCQLITFARNLKERDDR